MESKRNKIAVSEMDCEKIVIPLKNKMAVLIVQPFDGDVDVESILKIDYSNIFGEIITFPVLFNRIANMRAEMGNILAEAKLDLEIFEANLYEKHKKAFIAAEEKATDKAISSAVIKDPQYALKKKKFFEIEKNFNYTDALYWSAQSKDTKLNKLSEKLRPEDFENDIIEGAVNGILIKMTKKAIK